MTEGSEGIKREEGGARTGRFLRDCPPLTPGALGVQLLYLYRPEVKTSELVVALVQSPRHTTNHLLHGKAQGSTQTGCVCMGRGGGGVSGSPDLDRARQHLTLFSKDDHPATS